MVYVIQPDSAFVSGTFYEGIGSSFYLSPEKIEADFADVRFDRELRTFRRYCPRGRVLDVGCSTGGFLFQLDKRFSGNYQLHGLDASGPALAHAHSRGILTLEGDYLALEGSSGRYDAITLWAVLEHLGDPRAYLDKSAELVRPGGYIFALVPNFKSLAVRILGSKYRYLLPQHINYFTKDTLRRMVPSNMDVLALSSSHFNPFVIWQDARSGNRFIADADRVRLLRKTNALKRNPFLFPMRVAYQLIESGLARLGLADNLIMVLRRKVE